MLTLVLTVTSVLTLYVIVQIQRRQLFPPGPVSWPFFGNIFSLDSSNVARSLTQLSRKYGPVMKIELLWNVPVYVISDYNILKKILSSHDLSGRLASILFTSVRPFRGIIFDDYGPSWKEHRRFSSHVFRQFGVGKKIYEEKILDELEFILNEIDAQNGKPFSIKMLLHHAAASVIHSFLMGRMLQPTSSLSPYCGSATKERNIFFENNARQLSIIRMLFFTRHIPPFNKVYKTFQRLDKEIKDLIMTEVEEHKRSFQPSHLRDFIDCYLNEITQEDVRYQTFNENQLVQMIYDFFLAGNETSAQTVQWCLVAMVTNVEHQTKVYDEIVHVMGSKKPQMSHMEQMPYTKAFIEEIYRYKNIVPFGARKTTKEVKLGEYVVPANTRVFINIMGVHFDEKVFSNPQTFDPTRYLDADGHFKKCSQVIPFSLGPRDCVGQQLARTEVFIFLCGIFQHFEVFPDEEVPCFDGGVYGITNTPEKFKLLFKKRHFK